MALKPIKLGVSVGVGVANVAAKYYDDKKKWTKPFRRIRDYVALGATLIGVAGDPDVAKLLPADVSEALYCSGIPLLCDSVYEAAKGFGYGESAVVSVEQAGYVPATQTVYAPVTQTPASITSY